MARASIILASASPRRRALLEDAGLDLEVIAPRIDETPRPSEPPIPYAIRVASEKARSVRAKGVGSKAVLAADTVVAIDAEILGKAATEAEARSMLARLSNRTHTVHTAIAVLAEPPHDALLVDVVSTAVRFRALSSEEIARYVATGDPMDKAGAYGIQGQGGALVAEVRGSYTNVVGLPLEETLRLLFVAGVPGIEDG